MKELKDKKLIDFCDSEIIFQNVYEMKNISSQKCLYAII